MSRLSQEPEHFLGTRVCGSMLHCAGPGQGRGKGWCTMTLDLARIGAEVERMGHRLGATRDERRSQLERARSWLATVSPEWQQLADQARASKVSAAAPREALDASYPLPTIPSSYVVVATD